MQTGQKGFGKIEKKLVEKLTEILEKCVPQGTLLQKNIKRVKRFNKGKYF